MAENKKILAIDPGNIESGYVLLWHDGQEIKEILLAGKVPNGKILEIIERECNYDLAVEMIASYGMPVGKEVFDTCTWIGRFEQVAGADTPIKRIYREDEKINLCGTKRAKDANIRQALIDRFARFDFKNGKGKKDNQDFFYGFKADMWAAMAVAVTYFDMYVKK